MSFGQGASRGVARIDGAAECPCGSGERFERCCAPLHRGEPAPSAERLMRSRYTAFVVGDAGYLARSWHARTRPATVEIDPHLRWTSLRIVATERGGETDTTGVVEYVASFVEGVGPAARPGALRERSRFARRAGRWVYLDGEIG